MPGVSQPVGSGIHTKPRALLHPPGLAEPGATSCGMGVNATFKGMALTHASWGRSGSSCFTGSFKMAGFSREG